MNFSGPYRGVLTAGAMIHGRQIVIMLIVAAVLFVILWIPVLGDRFYDSVSASAPKVALPVFLIGLGLLGIGFAGHLTVLQIAGGAMAGTVVLAVILDNY